MFEVRTIINEDFTSLESLYIKSIRANKKGFIQDLERSKNIKNFIIDEREKGGNFFGVFFTDKLIGFGGYMNEGNSSMQICKLHLDKDYQRYGLGKLLLSMIEADAKYSKFKKFHLHVTNTQENALNLYIKMGYKVYKEEVSKVELSDGIYYFPTIYMNKNIL